MQPFSRYFSIALIVIAGPCYGAGITDIQVIKGKCGNGSHIAEGKMGEDLTKRQSRFFCDSAVITFFDNNNRHLMVQFSESQSHNNIQLGFSGIMQDDGQILNVSSVYLGNKKVQVSEGNCKFFFKGKRMSAIACGAPIDEGNRRTVPVVDFTASP